MRLNSAINIGENKLTIHPFRHFQILNENTNENEKCVCASKRFSNII